MAVIPYAHKTYINRLRRYIGDDATLNKLLEAEECTDQFLYDAILDTFDFINYEFSPETEYDLDNFGENNYKDFKSWGTLRTGAVLQCLIGKGILSARNTLTYNDASNITVQDMDQYGRYLNFFNILTNKFVQGVTMIKVRKNIEDCYGGVESAFSY